MIRVYWEIKNMKMCVHCQTNNPQSARFCMACGGELNVIESESRPAFNFAGLNLFMLSLFGSIALSVILIFVFRLPVFFLAAFLPLLWAGSKKDK